MGGKRVRPKTSETPPILQNLNTVRRQQQQHDRFKGPDDLHALTKEQLKLECRKRGQKTTGTKTELVCMCYRNCVSCPSRRLHLFASDVKLPAVYCTFRSCSAAFVKM